MKYEGGLKTLMYKMSDIIFKDVSLTKRAPAWKFFHANEEKRLAKCQIGNCSEVINWKNGLSGLSNHLRLIHKKIIKPKSQELNNFFTSKRIQLKKQLPRWSPPMVLILIR